MARSSITNEPESIQVRAVDVRGCVNKVTQIVIGVTRWDVRRGRGAKAIRCLERLSGEKLLESKLGELS